MKNLSMILKINFLVLALLIVGFFIFKLKNYGLSPELQSLLGFDPSQSTQGVATLEWCSPELRKAEIVTGNKLEGTPGLLAKDQQKLALWQKQFCKTEAIWTGEAVIPDEMNQVLLLGFGDSRPPIAIEYADDLQRFVWANKKFKSDDLKQAIKKLKTL